MFGADIQPPSQWRRVLPIPIDRSTSTDNKPADWSAPIFFYWMLIRAVLWLVVQSGQSDSNLTLWLVLAGDGLPGKERLCGSPGPRGPSGWVSRFIDGERKVMEVLGKVCVCAWCVCAVMQQKIMCDWMNMWALRWNKDFQVCRRSSAGRAPSVGSAETLCWLGALSSFLLTDGVILVDPEYLKDRKGRTTSWTLNIHIL